MTSARALRQPRRVAVLAVSLLLLTSLLAPLGATAVPAPSIPTYQACVYAGTLSQIGEVADPSNPSVTCGRGEAISLLGGDGLWGCLYAGSLTRVGTTQPACSRGEAIGLSTSVGDFHACLYAGTLSQVGTSELPSCGRGTRVELQDGVNAPPLAMDHFYATDEDTPLNAPAAAGVLAGSEDPDGDEIVAHVVSGPSHGTLNLNPDGSFVYTPDAEFYGDDAFTYLVEDEHGATSGVAKVAIIVTSVNDAPVGVDDELTGLEDSPILIGVLSNDSDPDGDELTISVSVSTSEQGGTVAVYTDSIPHAILYTPAEHFYGKDSFEYVLSDGHANVVVTVIIHVTPVDDPPSVGDDTLQTEEDTQLVFSVASLLENDSAPDGGPTLIDFGQPAHGTLIISDDVTTFTYLPDPDYFGDDEFTYSIQDADGDTATGTVTIIVTPVDDLPTVT